MPSLSVSQRNHSGRMMAATVETFNGVGLACFGSSIVGPGDDLPWSTNVVIMLWFLAGLALPSMTVWWQGQALEAFKEWKYGLTD